MISEKNFLACMGMEPSTSFMDIISRCLQEKGCLVQGLRNRKVGEIMTAPAVTGDARMTAGDMTGIFLSRRIKRLPIVDEQGRPLGIITRMHLIRAFDRLGPGVSE